MRLIRAVVLQEHRVSGLPPAPGRGLKALGRLRRRCGEEGRRLGGGGEAREALGQRGRGRQARVGDGALVAVAPPEGPAAAFHLTQAADGIEDDGGAVDRQLRQVQVRGRFAIHVGSDAVVKV